MKRVLDVVKIIFIQLLKLLVALSCLLLTTALLVLFIHSGNSPKSGSQGNNAAYEVMDRYDMFVVNAVSDALDGVMSIRKEYWLSDNDLVAPEPNQDCFGETDDPASLQWLLDDASQLLEGQKTLFQPDTEIREGSVVKYYFDETILVITWRQKIGRVVYTISEVKIADPSQFRRFLSDGEYASGSLYLTSEMAQSVNAVVATNGDYYAMRQMGNVIYNSQPMRVEGYRLDTCYIDANGDMVFVDYGAMTDEEEIKRFVQDNGVRFSLSFGPILIEDGEVCNVMAPYRVGEVDTPNARAALCQLDKLHYLLVVSSQPPFGDGQTMDRFANDLASFGCVMAYNLDGGRSATLVMNDELINDVYERRISDIIYFATAIPDGDS